MFFKPKDKSASGPLPKPARKTKQPRSPQAKFLNLAVILLIGFAAFQVIDREGFSPDTSSTGLLPESLVAEVQYDGDPRIDRLQQRHKLHAFAQVIPTARPAPEVQTLKAGAGPKAFCGQQVTYRILTETGHEDEGPGEPQTLRLGADPRQAGLALALLGMRAGELRRILIPADVWTAVTVGSTPPMARQLEVELLSLDAAAPSSTLPLRRFLRESGGGDYLRCGDMALLHLTLWDTNGKQFFTTEGGAPVYFIPGEGRVPFGLEQAVLEMAAGSEYSFLIPPEMFVPFNAGAAPSAPPPGVNARPWPADLALPEGRAILVDAAYPEAAPMTPPAAMPVTP